MSPGANKRPTGTVPKAKTTRKNSVPQEMVAPTRRDLQQHLNDFFASVQRVSSKTDNNRPSGDGNCYELENFSLPENTRSCWPVRPIPRRNFMHEASAMNDSHPLSSGPNQGGGSNAAIGVVIPTTPNSTLHHQQQNHINEQLLQHNNHHHHHQYNMNNLTATPPSSQTKNHNHHNYNHIDADNLMMSRANLYAKYESRKRIPTAVTTTPATTTASTNGLNVEDRLNQIQDYIRITTTLLDSIQGEKANGPRPQSVTSVHTTSTPNTPTYEELQSKLETSNRNIMHIKEQQQQLLRLQQAAKNNLYEMEQIRLQQQPLSFNNNNNNNNSTDTVASTNGTGAGRSGGDSMPDYETETDVQNDVRALMSRIKNLSDFVRNQSELASSMGIEDNEKPELLEEQLQLQKKLDELKTKKQQMANLVTELQSMNVHAENNFDARADVDVEPNATTSASGTARVSNLPSHHDIDIGNESIFAPMQSTTNCFNSSASSSDATKCLNENAVQLNANIDEATADDDENEDDDGATGGEHDDILHDKIAEINAMKEQLKRLQDMMHTVKLIEIKNGDCPEADGDAETDATTATPLNFNDSNATPAKPLNDASIGEDPQRDDDEEREMAERVRALHNMTHDLRQQAVSLAAERDRLKNIKNEMSRRRDYDHGSEKNFKQQQLQLSASTATAVVPTSSPLKDSNDDLDYVDNSNANEHNKKEPLATDASLFFASNWPATGARQASINASLPPRHHHVDAASSTTAKPTAVQTVDAADVLSLKSESSRGFSVPPPMRNINTRDGPWRKSSQEISRISSSAANNQPSHHQSFENATEQHSPWYWHNGSCYNGQSYNATGPQSPHCHYYHHMGGSEPHYCRPACSVPPTMSASHISSGSNDPMLLQQFIQTQQMLINSMSQCNQLLWDQQREINNLNGTVLLIQERLLNSAVNANLLDANQSNVLRAESVPPNVVCTNTGEFLPRAQSEQPNFQQLTTASPFRQYTTPSTVQPTVNLPIYRGVATPSGVGNIIAGPNIRLLRHNTLLNATGRGYFDADAVPSQYSNNFLNGSAVADASNILLNNSSLPSNNLSHNNNNNAANNINNNLNNNNNNASPQCQSSPQRFIYHNNNTGATNNANITNQLQQHQPTNTLNNQINPLNPPLNNYADNFRSYSRQNLLSSSSCKSNEDVCNTLSNASSSHSSGHRDRASDHLQQNASSYANQNITLPYSSGRNAAPTLMTHNNLPNMGNNKYLIQFRNQINQQQQQNTPDVLNMTTSSTTNATATVNAMAHESPAVESATVAAVNSQQYLLACGSGSASGNAAGNISEANAMNSLHTVVNNINSFNFDLNEAKQPKITTKTVQKCSTGGSKRIRSGRGGSASERENNLTATPMSLSSMSMAANQAAVHDLNLVSLANNNYRLDTKSSAKLFDDLKENVYLEVSALIAANESRPHFLINLFRELQLISTSDPLRKRLMEAFQELYTQYCETAPIAATIAAPIVDMQASMPASNVQNDLENPQQDTNQSNDHMLNYNQSAGRSNYVTSSIDSTSLCVPDLQSSIDEGFLRSIILDIREFLAHEPTGAELSETALQRIASIILRYLNNADATAMKSQNSQSSVDFDEIVLHLYRLERQNNDKFLEQLQNYLSFMLFTPAPPPQPTERIERLQQQQQPSRFDRCVYHSVATNENILTQRKNDGTIVIVRPQIASIDNQDLAEADQLCQFAVPRKSPRTETLDQLHDDNALSLNEPTVCEDNGGFHVMQPSNEDEIIVDMVAGGEIGAVGGIASPQLPDLAKVTTSSARILSLEDESACLVNAEVERITSHSYALPIHQPINHDFQHGNDSALADGNSTGAGIESDVIASTHSAVENPTKSKNNK